VRPVPAVAAAVTAGLIGALVVVPLESLGRIAADDGWTGIAHALSAPASRVAIEHTVAVATAVTVCAVTAGTALALAVERRPARSRLLPRLLVAGPLVIPEFVLGFAWSQAYGPAGLSDHLTGLTMPGLFGPAGIIAVLTVYGVPLAYLAVTAGLAARADPALERAARAAGANQWTTLRTVTLPLLRIPLLGAAALVFVTAAGSFAVPEVLGTPAGFGTMSTLIYTDLALTAAPAAFTELVVLSLTLVALVLLALGPLDLWLARLPRAARPQMPPAATGPTKGDKTVMVIVWAYAIIAAGIPMLTLILTALTRGPGLAPVPANWTLANFRSGFSGGAGTALARSAGLALAAAIAAPALGTLVAGLARGRWRGPLATVVTLAYAIPGSALAVGIIIGYGRWLDGTALIILVAYVAKFWVFGHRPVQAALDRLPPGLTRAARVSGARPATAARTVVLPPLTVAAVTAAGLVFVLAFHELTMSTILYGPGTETFAVVIMNTQDLGGVGATAALALVLTAPVVTVAALVAWLTRRPPDRPLYPERNLVPVATTSKLRIPDAVACAGLSVGYGRPALAGLDLAVTPGQTLALLGSSGSGKTTLLNAIAGFVAPLAGQIWLAGELASGPGRLVPPERRRIGMVFQDHALWPHLSVLDTVAYPLRRAGASRADAHRGAQAILEQMSLGPLAERRPGQLSGGEQQRVGLARALAGAPALYLFDEPTAHLDASLRAQILDEVARRRAADGAAAIYATHDATEALAIADQVAVLHSGRLAQLGSPAEVYAAPADLTVARLTGPVSVLAAPVRAAGPGHYTIDLAGPPATVPGTAAQDPDPVGPAVLVRPDWARLDEGGLPGTVTDVRFRGPHTDYQLSTSAGPLLIREAGPPRAGPGAVRWSLLRLRLLPRAEDGPAYAFGSAPKLRGKPMHGLAVSTMVPSEVLPMFHECAVG
jgi:iron(III) transport system permease protein